MENDQVIAMHKIALESKKQVAPKHRIYALNRVARQLGVPLLQATAADLVEWQASIRHLNAGTVRVYVTHLQQFYAWALDVELISVDPSRKLQRPKVRRGAPRPMHDQDLENLFAICTRTDLRLAFSYAAFAGLRCEEVARLHRNDVDLYGAKVVYVRGKGDKERVVPLIPLLIDEMHFAGESARRPGHLIHTATGKPYTGANLSLVTNEWLHETLGTESTFHSLRHWFGTNVMRFTNDPLFVRDLLGHSDLSTTQIYTQSNLVGAQDRLEKFDRLAERVTGKRRLHVVRDQ